jgi:hypothetical protein
VTLGILGHVWPAVGALHGLNALALFTAAIYSARRGGSAATSPAAQPETRIATPV